MKTFLLAAILGMISAVAHAQTTSAKPVVCGTVTEVVGELRSEQYNEQPIWHGMDTLGTTQYVVFTNVKSLTWTLVQFDNTTACILGTGSRSRILSGVQTGG